MWKTLREMWTSAGYDAGYEVTMYPRRWRRVRYQVVRLWSFCLGLRFLCLSLVCAVRGHKIRDCSTAGPDSGDMDHECTRCGRYWSVPLY